MDIQSLSTGLSQQRVQETAAVMLEGKAIAGMKEQGEAVMKLLNSAAPFITDPALGNRMNTLV
jgi:hypothetical protein